MSLLFTILQCTVSVPESSPVPSSCCLFWFLRNRALSFFASKPTTLSSSDSRTNSAPPKGVLGQIIWRCVLRQDSWVSNLLRSVHRKTAKRVGRQHAIKKRPIDCSFRLILQGTLEFCTYILSCLHTKGVNFQTPTPIGHWLLLCPRREVLELPTNGYFWFSAPVGEAVPVAQDQSSEDSCTWKPWE